MSDSLRVEREGRLLRLTLNRPEKRNALDDDLCKALIRTLLEADTNPEVGAILLEGSGSHFCAGMDLQEVLTLDASRLGQLHHKLFTIGQRLRKALVAQVQGSTVGGGVGLMLNAHIVAAAPGSYFGLTERRIGLWPYTIFGAVESAVGTRKATELALTARIFDLDEAVRLGIVDFVGEAEGLRIARELAESGAESMKLGLTFLRERRGLDAEKAGLLAVRARVLGQESEEFKHGVARFLKKRKT